MGIESGWAFGASLSILLALFAPVYAIYFARLADRRSWAISLPCLLLFIQWIVAIMTGLVGYLVWWNTDEDTSVTGFFILWFLALGVFAVGQWFVFAQCCYWAKWIIFVGVLGWIGTMVWGLILVWYSVFPSIAALIILMYWFAMSWSLGNIYVAGTVPRHVHFEEEIIIGNPPARKTPSKPSVAPRNPTNATPGKKTRSFQQYIVPEDSSQNDNMVETEEIMDSTDLPMHQPDTIVTIKENSNARDRIVY